MIDDDGIDPFEVTDEECLHHLSLMTDAQCLHLLNLASFNFWALVDEPEQQNFSFYGDEIV
jgi:hypothetical protein